MGVAYAANIGGVATLIGTPPNFVLRNFIEKSFAFQIPFHSWLLIGIPFSALFLVICYFVLVKFIYPNKMGEIKGSEKVVDEELKKMGKLSYEEKWVAVLFFLTALCWVFSKKIQAAFPMIFINDTIIALIFAFVLFIIPSSNLKTKRLLVWKDMKNLPWGILLLFGGGLSLANAMKTTGIINIIGEVVNQYQNWSSLLIVFVLITLVLFMTEVMSNVALITILLPVIAGIADGTGVEPLLVCIPVTIASSCAFMLPMATPPNAIVFASGYIKVSQMVKVGVVLNIIAVLLLIILYKFIVSIVF